MEKEILELLEKLENTEFNCVPLKGYVETGRIINRLKELTNKIKPQFTIGELENVFVLSKDNWIDFYCGNVQGADDEDVFNDSFELMKYAAISAFFSDEEIKERNNFLIEDGYSQDDLIKIRKD